MSIIETAVPIPIDVLKQYFEDKSTSFMIDYEKSELKGSKLITYLSNLDIPCDVKNYDEELIGEYLNSTMIVNIPALEMEVLSLIMMHKMNEEVPFKEEVESWEKKIDSLTLYNMYTLNDEDIKEWVKQHPTDDTKDLKGVNFISLLKNEETYCLFELIKQENLTYYSNYFEEYMFKGKNLFSYWANENNPLYLLTWGITSGVATELLEAEE
jgi:hypothetical protein